MASRGHVATYPQLRSSATGTTGDNGPNEYALSTTRCKGLIKCTRLFGKLVGSITGRRETVLAIDRAPEFHSNQFRADKPMTGSKG